MDRQEADDNVAWAEQMERALGLELCRCGHEKWEHQDCCHLCDCRKFAEEARVRRRG